MFSLEATRRRLASTACLLPVLLATGCMDSEPSQPAADAIYFGGPILTMEGDTPQYAEALVVGDGTILFVGAEDEAVAFRGEATRMIELQGRALLPGFIDAHGHVRTSKS